MRKQFNGGSAVSLKDLGRVEGIYTGAREVQRADGGTSLIHTFKPRNGESVDVWGFGQIDFALPRLRDRYVWLRYGGMQERETRFGVRSVHMATIEFDDGDDERPANSGEAGPPRSSGRRSPRVAKPAGDS